MYCYDYERLELSGAGWNLAGFGLTSKGYRDVIRRRAAEGWRFVTAVPLEVRASGALEALDLVFEKEIE